MPDMMSQTLPSVPTGEKEWRYSQGWLGKVGECSQKVNCVLYRKLFSFVYSLLCDYINIVVNLVVNMFLQSIILSLYITFKCTVVPLYTATLTSGHPSYATTIVWNKPFINVFNLSLTSGHPSYTTTIFIPQGWPHKRGTIVYLI